jgi:uncharacterized protein (DUF433 family)
VSNLLNRITVNPEVCGGRPCVRGLRVRVKDVLYMLATRAEILEDYPYLENDDITARWNLRRGPPIILSCRGEKVIEVK